MKDEPFKVLIVDDNNLNLAAIENTLKKKNYILYTATDGRTALKTANTYPFDLMLLDVVMPGMDGFEVCRRIKSNPQTSQLPVIFLTGKNDSESIRKGFELGAVDYVAKPFNEAELLARVNSHLELKRSKEELLKAISAAEYALKTKSDFLANMSHEIRTPINGIIGMSDFLSGTELSQKQNEYLRIIKSSSDSLLQLINDILDFSKIEAGRIEQENIDFDIREMLNDAVKTLYFKASEKGLNMFLNVDENLPQIVVGDPTKIRQVLLNLISNAMKFTAQGSIDVKTVLINMTKSTVKIKFDIIDTGIGITSEGIKKLFKSFSQVDASTTRTYGGTGLGLAISKRLSELMGGEIGVISEPGKGSDFWFTVVLKRSYLTQIDKKPSKIIKTTGEKKAAKQSLKILLAEDNIVNQKVATLHLERLGHVVEVAEDGKEAYKKFLSGNFDIVLMDVQMPVMDGFESTRRIRKFENQQNILGKIPIIAMTANAMKGDREKCLDAGMDDYISKPFISESLHNVLNKYF